MLCAGLPGRALLVLGFGRCRNCVAAARVWVTVGGGGGGGWHKSGGGGGG